MTTLYLPDVDDFRPIVDHARSNNALQVRKRGDFIQIYSDQGIELDRKLVPVRDALWFSCLVGGIKGKVVEFSADRIRIE